MYSPSIPKRKALIIYILGFSLNCSNVFPHIIMKLYIPYVLSLVSAVEAH